jgi:hypothetical protein
MSGYRAAAGDELGPLVEEVRPPRVAIRVILVCLLAIGLLADLGALLSPPKGVDGWLTLILIGVAFPVAALVGLFGRQADAVRLHEHGFVARGRAVRWDDVVELRTKRFVAGRNGRYRSTLDRYTIHLKNGETLDLRFAFANNDAVLEHIRERTREHLLRAAMLPITFGAITVDDAGVRTEFTNLTWSQIARAGFDGAMHNVVIRGPGSAWIEVPLHEVPNAHVLCAMVNARATAAAGP